MHHKNELRKIKKLIIIGDARKAFLHEKIRMLELEKYVFKDADTRARNHFLMDNMDENNERRSILIDAIDAAYHQWLDKLRDLKHEINEHKLDAGKDHEFRERYRHLCDELFEVEKLFNHLMHKKEMADLKARALAERDRMNQDFLEREKDNHHKIEKKRLHIHELKKALIQMAEDLLKGNA